MVVYWRTGRVKYVGPRCWRPKGYHKMIFTLLTNPRCPYHEHDPLKKRRIFKMLIHIA